MRRALLLALILVPLLAPLTGPAAAGGSEHDAGCGGPLYVVTRVRTTEVDPAATCRDARRLPAGAGEGLDARWILPGDAIRVRYDAHVDGAPYELRATLEGLGFTGQSIRLVLSGPRLDHYASDPLPLRDEGTLRVTLHLPDGRPVETTYTTL